MIYHFHIAHQLESAALSSPEKVQAYSQFSGRLRDFFASIEHMGISFAASEPDERGLSIWFGTTLDERSVHNLASSFLRDVDISTPGLKLAIQAVI